MVNKHNLRNLRNLRNLGYLRFVSMGAALCALVSAPVSAEDNPPAAADPGAGSAG